MKFGTLHQTLNPVTVTWPKNEIFKIQDGCGRHLENRFLAINNRPIVRFQQNCLRGSRTAGRQALRDEKCKFLKSNMADGRHFENRKIVISQWKIVRFWWNLVHYIRHWTRLQSRDQKIEIFKMQDGGGRHLENRFLAINHRPIVRFQRNFVWESRTTCWQGLRDKKNANV